MSVHRLTLSGTYVGLGITAQNVMHVQNPDGLFTPAQIADDFRAHWMNSWRLAMSNVFRWDYIEVRNRDNPAEMPVRVILSPTIQGATSFNVLSPVLTPILSFQTGLSGPRGRGRIYLPGIDTNKITQTRISNALAVLYQDQIRPVIGRYLDFPGSANAPKLCIAGKDYPQQGAPMVQEFILRQILGTQRRRNEQVGI